MDAGPRAIPRRWIGDRYECVRLIGRGGMGEVWQARDTLLHRDVALKRLTYTDESGNEGSAARTMREARLAARLNHPNAVSIYDVVMDDGMPCLVMELIDGHSLKEMILSQGRLDPMTAARIGREVARALAAAHRRGIVHRDVKPANVLIDQDGTAKLTDFGIARDDGDSGLTTTGTFIGTPSFLSPEIASGEPSTTAGDIWALGATLFAAVEGRPPFGTGNALVVLSRIALNPPPPPQHAGPLTPIVMGMMRRNADERPHAARVVHELDGVLRGAHDDAPPPRWPPGPPPGPPSPAGAPGSGLPSMPTGSHPGLSAAPSGRLSAPSSTLSGPHSLPPSEPPPSGRSGGSGRRKVLLAVAAVLLLGAVVFGVTFALTHRAPPSPTASVTPTGSATTASGFPSSTQPSTAPATSSAPSTATSSGTAAICNADNPNNGFDPAVAYLISAELNDIPGAQACTKPGAVPRAVTASLGGQVWIPPGVTDETGGNDKGPIARHTFTSSNGGSVVVTTTRQADGRYLVTGVVKKP
jgi:eukaryotic-like serine/threonine-protein kinase